MSRNFNGRGGQECKGSGLALGIIQKRCMPFGALSCRLQDACGDNVFTGEAVMDTMRTLDWAAGEHLVECTSMWDDDIAPWSQEAGGKLLDRQDQILASELQEFLRDSDLKIAAFGCNLARNPIFRDGALTSRSEAVRQLARRKIERAANIANSLGAETLRVFIGREGYDEPVKLNWQESFKRLADGLNAAAACVARNGSLKIVAILPGNNCHGRERLFLGGDAQTAMLASNLANPRVWKICPEADVATDLPGLILLAASDSLSYLPFSMNAKGGWLGRIPEYAQLIAAMASMGWRGMAEFVGMPLRSEAGPDERELLKRQHVIFASTALAMAGELAQRMQGDWNAKLQPSEAGIMAMAMCAGLDPDEIIRKAVAGCQANAAGSNGSNGSNGNRQPVPRNEAEEKTVQEPVKKPEAAVYKAAEKVPVPEKVDDTLQASAEQEALPTPEPVAPESVAVSAPAPAPESVAVSAPAPAPESVAVSAPESAPAPESVAVPAPAPAPEPESVAVSAPESAPAPESVAVSAPESAPAPVSEAVAAVGLEPAKEDGNLVKPEPVLEQANVVKPVSRQRGRSRNGQHRKQGYNNKPSQPVKTQPVATKPAVAQPVEEAVSPGGAEPAPQNKPASESQPPAKKHNYYRYRNHYRSKPSKPDNPAQ